MELIQQLIKIQSYSGQEKHIQKTIFSYLKKMGFNPGLSMGNIYLKIPGQKQQKALIFNAHVDTVMPGNLQDWKSPPFAGQLMGDKVFGVGASDEKAGIASLMLLAKEFKDQQPECDLWLTFVVKEELDGSGTQSCLKWFKNHGLLKKYEDISAILVEPTDLKKVQIAHKGNIFLKITTKGQSGHGSQPEKIQKHAIMEMIKVIDQIKVVQKQWEQIYQDELFGQPTLAITSLKSGDQSNPNKFPDSCELTLDIRTTPALHKKALKELKANCGGKGIEIDYLYQPGPLGWTDKNHRLIKIIQQILGNRVQVCISPGATDQCFFTETGIPAVTFGPGIEKVMHKSNEYCSISKINRAVDIYKKIISLN